MERERVSILSGVAVLYFTLALGTVWLARDSQLSPIWPANAALLALLLQPRRPPWSAVLLAAIAGNVLANAIARGISLAPVLWGAIDAGEVMIAAYALRRTIGTDEMLGAPETLGRFVLWAAVIAPAIGGLGYAAVTWLFFGQDFVVAFRLSYSSDALGLLVFTPFFTSLLAGEYRRWGQGRTARQYIEAAAIALLVTGTSLAIFIVARRPAAVLLFAPLMLATFRLGRLGTQFMVLIVAIIGSIGEFRDHSGFAPYAAQPEMRLHLMQFFLAVVVLTCLPVSAGLSARARLTRELAESERRLRAREAELMQLAATDALTGLMHRGALDERIAAAHHKGLVSVAMVDLDRFKAVNDCFGHDVGDQALIHFARVIESGVRHGDAVARIGGDEFMIFFPATDQAVAATVCERLAVALRDRPLLIDGGEPLALGMSCGVAGQREGEAIDALIKRADQALYAAKAAGRSRVLRAA